MSSIASPSLKFLGYISNSGNVSSITFHYRELIGCRRILSHFLPSTCHFKFFASSLMTNINVGKSQKTKGNNCLCLVVCVCYLK